MTLGEHSLLGNVLDLRKQGGVGLNIGNILIIDLGGFILYN